MSYFALLLATAALSAAGCDLFTTRVPEPPDGGDGAGWRFPASWQLALDNIRSAVGRKSSDDYVRTLAAAESGLPPYVWTPDPATVAAYPGLFDDWNLAREQQHIQKLFARTNLPDDSLALLELTVERQTPRGDTAEVSCGYRLHIGQRPDSSLREMEGIADFRILKSGDGGWYIQHWSDTRAAGKACWSDLKAAF